MNIPENLSYTESHEWVKTLADNTVEIGLTDYAQSQLGSLVFVNLPNVGDDVSAGDNIADVESVKSVSDVYSPVSGTVSEINEELLDSPETINQDPYGAWFARIAKVADTEELMDAAAYLAFIESAK